MTDLIEFQPDGEYAANLDSEDVLAGFRNRFFVADDKLIYLDGNSLGRLPLKTRDLLTHAIDRQWGDALIRSWNDSWYDLPKVVSGKLAKIVGAEEHEVITCDSTSVNLYKLAHAAIKTQPERKCIISDSLNFPTDLYVLQSIIHQFGDDYKLLLAPSHDNIQVDVANLDQLIDENTALIVLSHVAFKSAFMYNMKEINDMAHSRGALVLWDLSHAAGAVPVELSATGADMAVGCTYKYLNGGPGSPAFLYVNKSLSEKLTSPIWGWFGDRNPFAFERHYHPAKSISKFSVGTPPLLSLIAVEPGLDLILEAGLEKIREKSIRQSEYLIFLAEKLLLPLGFLFGSPLEYQMRGSHVSLKHPESYRICQAMINPDDNSLIIIPDFRAPDNIRFGITPLYTTYTEIYRAIKRVEEIVTDKIFERYSVKKQLVT
jgi:kynureninase